MTQQRIADLLQLAAQSNLNAVAIMPGPNMQYFSGLHFHLSERPTLAIFPVAGQPALICPAFEATKTQRGDLVTILDHAQLRNQRIGRLARQRPGRLLQQTQLQHAHPVRFKA